MVRIGAHDREGDPLAVVHATGADIVQFFLGDPQGWDAPVFPGGDAAALRDALAEAGVDAYIHAPYGINVASANNRIRIPSRKLLAQQLEAAAAIGAKGLVVHGGHVTGGVADDVGYDNWRKAMERIPRPIPLLIENTAGGDHAMARGVSALARLWDTIGDLAGAPSGNGDGQGAGQIGFCLDTCHAYAGGDELATVVDRVKAVTAGAELVPRVVAVDQVDPAGDRHAPIESGEIEPAMLLDVVRAAGAPVISETPDPGADIRWLRQHLPGA